jgi:hypothetical protein
MTWAAEGASSHPAEPESWAFIQCRYCVDSVAVQQPRAVWSSWDFEFGLAQSGGESPVVAPPLAYQIGTSADSKKCYVK